MRVAVISIILVIFFPLFATNQTTILNYNDYILQKSDEEQGPTLSSSPSDNAQWESYNKWQCFSTSNASLKCTLYDSDIQVPTIEISFANFKQIFDVPVDEKKWNCEQTLPLWTNLLENSHQICLYSAYMPMVNDLYYGKNWSLWYIEKIKTDTGYWNLSD